MNNEKPLISIIIVGMTLAAIMFSGCTGDSVGGIAVTTAATETNIPPAQQEETPDNAAAVSATKAPGEKLSEPLKLPGSITEETAKIPLSDPETEENLLSEAKAEIMRVFAGADVSSLNNYHWDSDRAGSFLVPVIIFEGVIADAGEPNNVCKIVYDPEKGRVVLWEYDRETSLRDISGGEIIRHEDVDIEEDIIPVFRRMIGEEEYEKNKENYFIYTADSENFPLTTIAYIRESCKGVKSYMGKAQVYFNRANGEVAVYGENYNDKGFFKKAVALSPVPEISFEEAKSILEAKLDELYPDDPQEIKYKYNYSPDEDAAEHLLWLDASAYLDIKDDCLLSPIPLAWEISYNTKESRDYCGDRYVWAAVDAKSGEILSLHTFRIDIHGKTYD